MKDHLLRNSYFFFGSVKDLRETNHFVTVTNQKWRLHQYSLSTVNANSRRNWPQWRNIFCSLSIWVGFIHSQNSQLSVTNLNIYGHLQLFFYSLKHKMAQTVNHLHKLSDEARYKINAWCIKIFQNIHFWPFLIDSKWAIWNKITISNSQNKLMRSLHVFDERWTEGL